MNEGPITSAWQLMLSALLLIRCPTQAADQPSRTDFFLPQNPVAAAYVLGRLSNRELVEAPRSEFVYVALLQRNGLERKYRLEALTGLAAIRHTTPLGELLKALNELDSKADDRSQTLRELTPILLQTDPAQLRAEREQLSRLALQAQKPVTRQLAWAACITADASSEPGWTAAAQNPAQLADLLLGVPMLENASLKGEFYEKLIPLVRASEPKAVQRAAIEAIVAVPGHDTDVFNALAALVRSGTEPAAAVGSLSHIPRASWPQTDLEQLGKAILGYLATVPPSERGDSSFANALQFASELASMLPAEARKAFLRTLHSIGPIVVTLHAVYEQMRFDKDQIVVEAGKPVLLVLQNDDAMPHNLVLMAPGALKEVGQAAEAMPPVPDPAGRLYVPASAKVLQSTKLVSPGQHAQLAFDAPAELGDYPFACTFPGHWLRMSGTLAVVPDLDAYLETHPLTTQPRNTEWKLADFGNDLGLAGSNRDLQGGSESFAKLACAQCHTIGSQGHAYGPDLSDVFKRYNNDRATVLQQILEPSARIDERYRNVDFELKNGDSVTGLIVKEDPQTMTVQTGPADSLIQVLQKSDVQNRRPMNSSPMPVGLLNSLSKDQIFNLLAFLECGGQVPPHQHSH